MRSVFYFLASLLLVTLPQGVHSQQSDRSTKQPQQSTTTTKSATTDSTPGSSTAKVDSESTKVKVDSESSTAKVDTESTTSATVPTSEKPHETASQSTTKTTIKETTTPKIVATTIKSPQTELQTPSNGVSTTESSDIKIIESRNEKAIVTTKGEAQTTETTEKSQVEAIVTSSPKSVEDNSTKLNSSLAKFYQSLVPIKQRPMPTVSKSYHTDDPIISYCSSVSMKLDPVLKKLADNTLENAPMSGMLGAPEVLQFGQNFIRLIQAKRVLDIGTFTGASALAWGLALPPDGEVTSMDISHENLNKFGKEFIDSRPDISKKITFKLAPAVETLDALIKAGDKGKWDFAFIDADKQNYPNYYEKCIQLLRPGGVLLIDNALWGGSVIFEEKDPSTKAIDETNHLASNDTRVDNMLLNLGDGTHVVFKKFQ